MMNHPQQQHAAFYQPQHQQQHNSPLQQHGVPPYQPEHHQQFIPTATNSMLPSNVITTNNSYGGGVPLSGSQQQQASSMSMMVNGANSGTFDASSLAMSHMVGGGTPSHHHHLGNNLVTVNGGSHPPMMMAQQSVFIAHQQQQQQQQYHPQPMGSDDASIARHRRPTAPPTLHQQHAEATAFALQQQQQQFQQQQQHHLVMATPSGTSGSPSQTFSTSANASPPVGLYNSNVPPSTLGIIDNNDNNNYNPPPLTAFVAPPHLNTAGLASNATASSSSARHRRPTSVPHTASPHGSSSMKSNNSIGVNDGELRQTRQQLLLHESGDDQLGSRQNQHQQGGGGGDPNAHTIGNHAASMYANHSMSNGAAYPSYHGNNDPMSHSRSGGGISNRSDQYDKIFAPIKADGKDGSSGEDEEVDEAKNVGGPPNPHDSQQHRGGGASSRSAAVRRSPQTSHSKAHSARKKKKVPCFCCEVRGDGCTRKLPPMTGNEPNSNHLSDAVDGRDDDEYASSDSGNSFSRTLEREIESLLSGDGNMIPSMNSSLQRGAQSPAAGEGGDVTATTARPSHADPAANNFRRPAARATSPTLSVSDDDDDQNVTGTPGNDGNLHGSLSGEPKPLMQPPALSVSPSEASPLHSGHPPRSKLRYRYDTDRKKHCAHCQQKRRELHGSPNGHTPTPHGGALGGTTASRSILASHGTKREKGNTVGAGAVTWAAIEADARPQYNSSSHNHPRSFVGGGFNPHERSFGRMSQDAAGGSMLATSSRSISSSAIQQAPTGASPAASPDPTPGAAIPLAGAGGHAVQYGSPLSPSHHPQPQRVPQPQIQPAPSTLASIQQPQHPLQHPPQTHPQYGQQQHSQYLHAVHSPNNFSGSSAAATFHGSVTAHEQALMEAASLAMRGGNQPLPHYRAQYGVFAQTPSNRLSSPHTVAGASLMAMNSSGGRTFGDSSYLTPASEAEGDMLYIDSTRYRGAMQSGAGDATRALRHQYATHGGPNSNALPAFSHPFSPSDGSGGQTDRGTVSSLGGTNSMYPNVASLNADDHMLLMSQPSLKGEQVFYQRSPLYNNVPANQSHAHLNGGVQGLHPQQRRFVPEPLQSHVLEAQRAEITAAQLRNSTHPSAHYMNNPYSANHPQKNMTAHASALPNYNDYLAHGNGAQGRRPSHASHQTSSSPGGEPYGHGHTPAYTRPGYLSHPHSPHSARSNRSGRQNTPKSTATQSTATPASSKKKVQPPKPDPQVPPIGPPYKTLLVNFIANTVTSDEVEKLFSAVGRLEGCRIIKDRKTNRSKGYAFIYYENADDAERAKTMLGGDDAMDGATAPAVTVPDPAIQSIIDDINSALPPTPPPGTHVVLPSAGGPGVSLKGKRIKITFSTNPLNQMVAHTDGGSTTPTPPPQPTTSTSEPPATPDSPDL